MTWLGGSSGSGPADWLAGHLLDRRVVMVSGALDPAVSGNAIAQLMTLDAEGDEAIELYLDAEGDDLGSGLALMDVIDLLGVEVIATCIGRAGGTAIGVLAVCSVRRVSPNARLRLSEPRFDLNGTASEAAAWRRHADGQMASFVGRLAQACGKDPGEVAADLSGGRFLSAAQAVAYGLADSVAGQLSLVAGNSDS